MPAVSSYQLEPDFEPQGKAEDEVTDEDEQQEESKQVELPGMNCQEQI